MSEVPSTRYQGFYAFSETLKGIYYGPGCVETALPKLLDTVKATKAMVLTGKSLYTKTDVVKKVEDILRAKDAYGVTFYDIGEHTPIAGIRNALKLFRKSQCDVIVSVGGGSPVDAAKAILYNLQLETGGPTLSSIAIPTTLSAAEYTIGAGFTGDDGKKIAVSSPLLAPAGIILDAGLTLATPERLWLSSGIRALDHAVENLYRPRIPPPLKAMCYSALVDLFKYLPECKANPQDVRIRQKLQIASWSSIWPVKLEQYSALGLSHALGHKLGAAYGIPHGITSCITLGPVVELKAEIGSQEDKEYLADCLFYLKEPSTGSLEGDVKKLGQMIKGLVKDLGLQTSLTEYKVPKEDIPGIAKLAAMGTPLDKVEGVLYSLY